MGLLILSFLTIYSCFDSLAFERLVQRNWSPYRKTCPSRFPTVRLRGNTHVTPLSRWAGERLRKPGQNSTSQDVFFAEIFEQRPMYFKGNLPSAQRSHLLSWEYLDEVLLRCLSLGCHVGSVGCHVLVEEPWSKKKLLASCGHRC